MVRVLRRTIFVGSIHFSSISDRVRMSNPAEPPPSSSSVVASAASLREKQQHIATSSSSPTPPVDVTDQPHQLMIPSPNLLPPAAFDYHPDFGSAVKKPRYVAGTSGSQWKQLLPSPTPSSSALPLLPPKPQQQQALTTDASSPSSTTNNPPLPLLLTQHPSSTAGASSSDTAASSPTRLDQRQHQQQSNTRGQLRKGKHVSPVWKPYEMLMLAKGWHLLYQTSSSLAASRSGSDSRRGINKSRAEKDREVAEFLNRHGVERDAKAAGTKWDNMLGDFRKVYQWERGGGRVEAGVAKSYFRLSPYERKNQHGLPTSFDEEVFEEMAQFMGNRIRSNSSSTSLLQLSGGGGKEPDDDGDRGRGANRLPQLTLEENDAQFGSLARSDDNTLVPASSSVAPLRRIGKVKMVWEESVSLWGEEGSGSGRMKIGLVPSLFSSFLNANELVLFDDSMVASSLEAYENGPLRGFSVDVFSPGQQVKVFGRRKAASNSAYCHACRSHLPVTQLSPRSYLLMECQDPSDYYLARIKSTAPVALPALSELSLYLQQPPSEDLKFPLRRDVYRDLPQGKDHFFTTLNEPLDCRVITYDILGPILRSDLGACSTSSSRYSYIALWDDCINSVVRKFCSLEMAFVRKPTATPWALSQYSSEELSWLNITGFVKGLCLWRGEEKDHIGEGDQTDPSKSLVEKTLWTYGDLPYIFGYYAVGWIVTLCALTRHPHSSSQLHSQAVLRTDLISIDLSSQVDRLKALIPCWRIATLLPLLADKYSTSIETGHLLFSDFERIALGNNSRSDVIERTPNSQIRYFSNKRKWASVKEIYDFLGRRIPHSEYIAGSCEAQLCITLKPRGCKIKPRSVGQLIEALKSVSKCLVALHDLSFMHRDISWETVMRRVILHGDNEEGLDEVEWFLSGFEGAAGAPQMSAVGGGTGSGSGSHAPEMRRGLHGVKVDVWGIGWLIKTCGLVMLPMQLRDLQSRCLEHNQEMRPTAADCYHHLLQLSAAAAGGY